jgi:DNA repair exonuclease SbcCD nuclease subunit
VKFLISADWQARLSNLQQCVQTVEHMKEIGKKRAIDAFLILGDVKQDMNPVDVRVANFLVSVPAELSKACTTGLTYVIGGNHDATSTQDGSPTCLPWMAASGAMVFEEPELVYAAVADVGVELCCVPFRRNKEELRKSLQTIHKSNRNCKKILLFHEEIRGCKLNMMTRGVSTISLEDIRSERYAACIGGHIHFQQLVSENVWYVGSPFCHDWGEANQQKGFLLLEVNKKGVTTVTSIPSRIPGWYDTQVPGFPTDRKLETGATLRIRIKSNASVELMEKRISQAAAQHIGVVIHVKKEHEEEEPVSVEGALGNTDAELLRSYLQQTVPEKQIGPMLSYLKRRITGSFAVGIAGIKLENAIATNVLCFENCQLDLTKPGLTLVTGKNEDWGEGKSNGAGKSSLLSLPALALFGETLKGQKHDQWMRNGSTTAAVALEAVLPDGRKLAITRGRKPGFLTLTVNGKDQSMGDAARTQRRIEELTGLTWDVFVNSIYIGQYEITTLLYGTDKQRKELFSRFLGLERFIKAQELVRKDLRELTACQIEIRSEAEIAATHVEELAIGIVRAQTELEEPCEKPDYVPRTSKEKTTAQKQIEEIESWLDENQTRFEKYLDAGYKADARREECERWIEKLDEMHGACPLCGTAMSSKSRKNHEQELNVEITKQQEISDKWEELKSQNRKKRQAKQSELLSCRQKIVELEKLEQLYQLWQQAEERRQERARLIAEAEERKAFWEKRRRAHVSYLEQLETDKEFLEACLRSVSREGLPAYLCSTVCGRLNQAARRYSELFTEDEIQVQFKLVDGELELELNNAHGGKEVQDQSMGELRLAGLVAIFAFRELLVPCNVLFLDEPGEGLDQQNAQIFASGLMQVVKKFGKVFLVTHNPNIVSAVEPDEHLEVVKKNDVAALRKL